MNTAPGYQLAPNDVASPSPLHLHEADTVFQALARLRSERNGDQPVYFYVTDSSERLIGVIPTCRLLLSEPSTLVGELITYPVISVNESARFGEALAVLAEQRLLALPVVDELGRLTGTIDISGTNSEDLGSGAGEKRRMRFFRCSRRAASKTKVPVSGKHSRAGFRGSSCAWQRA